MDETKTNSSSLSTAFFDHGLSTTLMLLFSTIVSLMVLLFLYGIIWYERFGSDSKRTLVNQIVSSICYQLIISIIILQLPTNLQYVLQWPYYPLVCSFRDFAAATLLLQLICKYCIQKYFS